METNPAKWFMFALSIETDECIVWPFARDINGYGRMTTNNLIRSALVHRVACAERNGLPPSDCVAALHLCSNPPCMNYRHLAWGTQRANMQQASSENRMRFGEGHGGHKLTSQQVIEIRDVYASGTASHRSLAEQYGCSHTAIGKIVNGNMRVKG